MGSGSWTDRFGYGGLLRSMDVSFDPGFVNDGDSEIGTGTRGENKWSYCFQGSYALEQMKLSFSKDLS